MVAKNATAYTWHWYRHLVGDRALLVTNCKKVIVEASGASTVKNFTAVIVAIS